jgi:hypothetical protein
MAAAAAARCAGPAAVVDLGADRRRSMVAAAAGGAASAAGMGGPRGWSVAAAGSAGRRFFSGSGNLQAVEGGAGVHRYVSMSAAAASLRAGHLFAPPTSYATYQGEITQTARRFLESNSTTTCLYECLKRVVHGHACLMVQCLYECLQTVVHGHACLMVRREAPVLRRWEALKSGEEGASSAPW